MRLVDDHRVVAAQQRVAVDLGQQQAVGHQPHERVLRAAVAEAHREADRAAERHLQLVGDPLGDRARGQPPRLGVGDRAAHAAPQLQAQLRDLRRLARAGLARHDHDLVVADRRQQVLAAGADRQLGRVGDRGHRGAARGHPRLGALDLGLELRSAAGSAWRRARSSRRLSRCASRSVSSRQAGAEVGGGRGHDLRIWTCRRGSSERDAVRGGGGDPLPALREPGDGLGGARRRARRATRSCSWGRSRTSRSASGCGSRARGSTTSATGRRCGSRAREPVAPTGEAALGAYLRRVRHVGRARAEQLLRAHGEDVLAAIDRDPHGRLPRGRAEPAAGRRGRALLGRAALHPRAAPAAGAPRPRLARAAHRGALRRPRAPRGPRAAVRPHRRLRRRLPRRRHDRARPRRGGGLAARARAGVVHVLAEAERNGSTCLPVGELAAAAGELLGAAAGRAAARRDGRARRAGAGARRRRRVPGPTGRRRPSWRRSWRRRCAGSLRGRARLRRPAGARRATWCRRPRRPTRCARR